MFQAVRFSFLLDQLAQTRQWLAGMGIDTKDTRFEAIEDVVGKLVERGSPDRAIEVYGLERVYHALRDGNAFARIAQAFSQLKSHEIPRRSLRRALLGPLCPTEEELGSPNTDARNVAAELELAAELKLRGAAILDFDDVSFTLAGRTVRVQVKRPGSTSGVGSNLAKARKQLRDRLTGNELGVVAVDVDRVLGLYQQQTIVRDENGLLGKISALTDEFSRSYQDEFKLFVDPRVVAVLLIFRLLVRTEGDVFVPAYSLSVIRLAMEEAFQATERAFLCRLVEALEKHNNSLQRAAAAASEA